MTEEELRKECNLEPKQLINTNLGLLDILNVCNGMVSLGVLATGQVINESCSSVISKLKNLNSASGT